MFTYSELRAVVPQDIELTERQAEKLDRYAEMLVERNSEVNLTAITDSQGVMVRHFEDCIRICPYIPQNAKLADVGTGAGFPGMVIAMMRPDVTVTMMDTINKKLDFLIDVEEKLGTDADTEIVKMRAEEAGRTECYREAFDCVTARAVADLTALAEYCLPLVRVGGLMLAMKGSEGENEADAAAFAVRELGAEIEKIEKYTLSDGSERSVILCRKTAATPEKYPRNAARIKKNPLNEK